MKTISGRLRLSLLIFLTIICAPSAARAQNPCAPAAPQTSEPLASKTLELARDWEVALEIEARSPGASWARKGAEAAALVVTVDGAYNQNVLLWAGDSFHVYRVMLGRLPKGSHKISVALDEARSAAGARRAEVKSLRTLTPSISITSDPDEHGFALAHAPVLYARANTIDHFTDIPLLMYYEILHEGDEMVV
ncbi:MAG: hypothetical protein ACJ74T_10865, partial [Pyrinomonadaceae bacterium]